MGNDLIRALSRPFESAVHDCAQISSESDCNSGCCSCHTKTIAPDTDPDEDGLSCAAETDEPGDAEINTQTKENG